MISPCPARIRIEVFVEEAIVDAYGESEQRVGFLAVLEASWLFRPQRIFSGHPSPSNAWISTTPTRSWRSAAADDSGS